MKNKYISTHLASLSAIEDQISKETGIAKAVAGSVGESGDGNDQVATSGNGAASKNRTLASPDYDGCTVPNFDKRVELVSKPMEEFTAGRTLSW